MQLEQQRRSNQVHSLLFTSRKQKQQGLQRMRSKLSTTAVVTHPQAYKKFPGQAATYGQLKLPLLPLDMKIAAFAVGDQIARNMMLPEAPLMMSAPNGTLIKTMGGVDLYLFIL